jgi:hypothetical protein
VNKFAPSHRTPHLKLDRRHTPRQRKLKFPGFSADC